MFRNKQFLESRFYKLSDLPRFSVFFPTELLMYGLYIEFMNILQMKAVAAVIVI